MGNMRRWAVMVVLSLGAASCGGPSSGPAFANVASGPTPETSTNTVTRDHNYPGAPFKTMPVIATETIAKMGDVAITALADAGLIE